MVVVVAVAAVMVHQDHDPVRRADSVDHPTVVVASEAVASVDRAAVQEEEEEAAV